jgi:hypothetical protein
MLHHPDNLTDGEQLGLKQVLASCSHLETTAAHVTAFAEMLTGRRGDRLASWMAVVALDDLPQLHRFVRGIERDYAGVRKLIASVTRAEAVLTGLRTGRRRRLHARGRWSRRLRRRPPPKFVAPGKQLGLRGR